MEDVFKICKSCKKEKPLDDFNNHKGGILGKHSRCRLCKTSENRFYYNNNKEKENKRTLFYKKINSEKICNIVAARRVKEKITLTKEESLRLLNIYKQCKTLQIETGEVYHVDHIIPISKGGKHHPDNLQILLAIDNLKKSDKLI